MSMRQCARCLRFTRIKHNNVNCNAVRQAVPRAGISSTSTRLYPTDYSIDRQSPPHIAEKPGTSRTDASSSSSSIDPIAEARSRAWYLEDDDLSPSTSSSSSSSSRPRRPRFTTFDPSRTTSETSEIHIQPLPEGSPEWLGDLHSFMTSEEGSEVLEPETVVFMSTLKPPKDTIGDGEVVKTPAGLSGPIWDWVVVGVVKGSGRGVVGRADRALRSWVGRNPSFGKVEKFKGEHPRFPRVAEDTDWSLIGIPERRLCINLFTAAGRDRWDLESLWGTSKRVTQQQILPDLISR